MSTTNMKKKIARNIKYSALMSTTNMKKEEARNIKYSALARI